MKIRELSLILALALVACLSIATKAQAQVIKIDGSSTVFPVTEAGIDISGQRSKGTEAVPMETVDLLITLCGEAEEACPTLATKVKRQHWRLPDPALAQGDAEELLRVFRAVRDEIQRRVENLLAGDRALPGPTGGDGEPKGEIVQR